VEAVNDIISRAKKRAVEGGFPYAGVLSPLEVYDILQNAPHAVLVDVRTHAELQLVGSVPDAVSIEWATYPGMVANADFPAMLEAQVDKRALVVFMCRTGGRSHHAASVAAQLGFAEAYNMLEGFEGEANAEKQRTLINGWRHADLPWHH
jgi:rhodanese-related sulfurtransferase